MSESAPARVIGSLPECIWPRPDDADHFIHLRNHLIHLIAGGTDERLLVGQRGIQRRPVQRQPRIVGQALQQVGFGAAFAHVQRRRYGMLPDHMVRSLAAHAGAHRGDQHFGGGQERR